jgi:hypothetical protein
MIKYHYDIIQDTDEWRALRCGLLTASEMKLIITPTLKVAANDKSRSHVWELLGQRIEKYVEPSYQSFDMMRGKEDELEAKILYNQHYAPVQDCGFVTNDEWGFTIGYSPDGLIGEDGLIEAKSRCQKYQVETIIDYLPINKIPEEYVLQVQTGLLVTRRKWCDFISYGNGQPMVTIRVEPDLEVQRAIIEAATAFEKQVAEKMARYEAIVSDTSMRLIKTVRKNRETEIQV